MIDAEDPAETFARKAPLLSRTDLAGLIRDDILADPISEHARSIWLYGAFADPDAEIDDDCDLSPLRVWVEHPGVAGEAFGTRFTADRSGLLFRLATHGGVVVYDGGDRWDDFEGTHIQASDEAVEATLKAAERAVVWVNDRDRDCCRFRPLDLVIGPRHRLQESLDGAPALRLWLADE